MANAIKISLFFFENFPEGVLYLHHLQILATMLPHIYRPLVCQVLQIFIHYVDLVKAAKKWRVGLFSIGNIHVHNFKWRLKIMQIMHAVAL